MPMSVWSRRIFAATRLLYNGLVQLDVDAKVVNALAESLEPNATATEWTVRLRQGPEIPQRQARDRR